MIEVEKTYRIYFCFLIIISIFAVLNQMNNIELIKKYPISILSPKGLSAVSIVQPLSNAKSGLLIMEYYKCNKCGVEYPFTEEFFKKGERYKNGLRKVCENCTKILDKQYRKEHKEGRFLYHKIYCKKNKEQLFKKNRKYRLKNKEKIQEKAKKYRIEHRKEISIYQKNKRKIDINHKIKQNLRKRIWDALKGNAKSKRTMELLGCDIDFFKSSFENKFTKGMTWKKYMNGEIHIDHKIPCAKFDLSDRKKQLQCFNYRNLQPLWAKDNFSKNGKLLLKYTQLSLTI